MRDTAQIEEATQQVLDTFGRIDVCIANVGICGFAPVWEITDEMWDDMIATDLSGVFKTFRAVLPHMLERGSGRLIATSSMAGRMGNANLGHYVAAKWGVIGLVKTIALEVAARGITVNAVCPTTVDTPMVHNRAMYSLFAPHIDDPTEGDVRPSYERMNPMSLAWLDPDEVSQAVRYLAVRRGAQRVRRGDRARLRHERPHALTPAGSPATPPALLDLGRDVRYERRRNVSSYLTSRRWLSGRDVRYERGPNVSSYLTSR